MANPHGRPKNVRRIESMQRWYEAAQEMVVIRDHAVLEDLYGGEEFSPMDTGMTPLQEFLRVQKLFPLLRVLHATEKLVGLSEKLHDKVSSPLCAMHPKAEERLTKIEHGSRELYGFVGSIRARYDEHVSDEEVELLNWHFLRHRGAAKLRQSRRTDAMLTYEVAAALFNSQLKEDQQGNPDLGIKPDRLDEKPITGNALRVAMIREMDPD